VEKIVELAKKKNSLFLSKKSLFSMGFFFVLTQGVRYSIFIRNVKKTYPSRGL